MLELFLSSLNQRIFEKVRVQPCVLRKNKKMKEYKRSFFEKEEKSKNEIILAHIFLKSTPALYIQSWYPTLL